MTRSAHITGPQHPKEVNEQQEQAQRQQDSLHGTKNALHDEPQLQHEAAQAQDLQRRHQVHCDAVGVRCTLDKREDAGHEADEDQGEVILVPGVGKRRVPRPQATHHQLCCEQDQEHKLQADIYQAINFALVSISVAVLKVGQTYKEDRVEHDCPVHYQLSLAAVDPVASMTPSAARTLAAPALVGLPVPTDHGLLQMDVRLH
mmetsp:Transcript_36280/g.103691  ORF Transcript_36280/g.103691 Transcript_36280/m.103691 type:complete len:203 (-) Transcript_36280:272-880(-)